MRVCWRTVAGALAALSLAVTAFAADLETTPAPPAPSPAAPSRATAPQQTLKDFLAATPDCAEATDRCRVCLITAPDNVACSNVGIACRPEAWTCTSKRATTPAPGERK